MASSELISDKKRQEIESLIYKIFDTIDKTHTNSNYYKDLFSKMNNNDFYHFFERRLPLRLHVEEFKIEPKMQDVIDAFKILKKPLLERVNLPYVYINENGIPVQSQECMVIYLHIKRMKQMLSKKTNSSMRIEKRDMRTGLLQQGDKAAKETDREFEGLASYGLDYTMDEFRTIKADAMDASTQALAAINTKGTLSEKDYDTTRQDGLARNMLNVYLLGANIHSNLVDEQYMTPYTMKRHKQKLNRV